MIPTDFTKKEINENELNLLAHSNDNNNEKLKNLDLFNDINKKNKNFIHIDGNFSKFDFKHIKNLFSEIQLNHLIYKNNNFLKHSYFKYYLIENLEVLNSSLSIAISNSNINYCKFEDNHIDIYFNKCDFNYCSFKNNIIRYLKNSKYNIFKNCIFINNYIHSTELKSNKFIDCVFLDNNISLCNIEMNNYNKFINCTFMNNTFLFNDLNFDFDTIFKNIKNIKFVNNKFIISTDDINNEMFNNKELSEIVMNKFKNNSEFIIYIEY